MRDQVHQPRRQRRQPGPPVDQAHRVGVPRPEPPLVVVREELGLVRGHVHVHRALGAAPLARQAEVERLLHGLALPAPLHRVALEHLEEQVGAAAGRVHLLLGHHVARAHGAVLFLAALADADAALGRVGEAPLVVQELEVRLDLGRVVGGAEPEVLARQVGVDHLVGVHLVVGVPDRLELAEGPDQLRPEHLRQERGLRLAVAVLAGDRPAVADDQVARLVQELAEVLHALVGLQLEVDPGVDAALAEVAVERAVVAVLLEQLAEVAEVRADAVGRHGGIFPPLPGVLLAGNAGGRPQARLADLPQVLFLRLVVEQLHRRRVGSPPSGGPSACGPCRPTPSCSRRRTRPAASRPPRAAG